MWLPPLSGKGYPAGEKYGLVTWNRCTRRLCLSRRCNLRSRCTR